VRGDFEVYRFQAQSYFAIVFRLGTPSYVIQKGESNPQINSKWPENFLVKITLSMTGLWCSYTILHKKCISSFIEKSTVCSLWYLLQHSIQVYFSISTSCILYFSFWWWAAHWQKSEESQPFLKMRIFLSKWAKKSPILTKTFSFWISPNFLMIFVSTIATWSSSLA